MTTLHLLTQLLLKFLTRLMKFVNLIELLLFSITMVLIMLNSIVSLVFWLFKAVIPQTLILKSSNQFTNGKLIKRNGSNHSETG